MGANYSFEHISIETCALQLIGHNKVFLGSVWRKKILSYFLYLVNCGGVLTEAAGKITSPEYPMAYPYYQNCTWNIACTGSVEITINYFEVGPTPAGLKTLQLDSV